MRALSLAFGQPLEPIYHFERANAPSLDADFLQSMPGSVRYARDFAGGRGADTAAGACESGSTPSKAAPH
ncbi:MAG: hypothetical protein R2911_25025 [Caldilineaceae bacterium]